MINIVIRCCFAQLQVLATIINAIKYSYSTNKYNHYLFCYIKKMIVFIHFLFDNYRPSFGQHILVVCGKYKDVTMEIIVSSLKEKLRRQEITSQISLTQKFPAWNSRQLPLTEVSVHLRASIPTAHVLPKQGQLGFAKPRQLISNIWKYILNII